MQDHLTFDLNQYYLKQEHLEKEWNMTMQSKQHEVVSLAKKILKQEVDTYTFELAFGKDYINVSDDAYEFLISSLEDIEYGRGIDCKLKHSLAYAALEAAAYSLYDCELEEITPADENANRLVLEVLG